MNTQTQRREENTIDLVKIFYVLLSKILVIIIVTVICAAIGFAYSKFFIAPTYQATAEMVVNNKTDEDSKTSSSITNSDLTTATSLVETYGVILKSHSMLQTIIDDLGLDISTNKLSDKIAITSVNETQIMKITVTDTDVNRALQITEKIVELAPDAIMSTVNAGSVNVVDEPWSTGQKVGPSTVRNTVIAALIGFIVTIIIIIIVDLSNNTFRSEEDVRATLGLPILGVIPVDTESPDVVVKKKKNADK